MTAFLLAIAALAMQDPASVKKQQDETSKPDPKIEPHDKQDESCCETEGPHYLTIYGHHIEKGEIEVMLSVDFTAPSSVKRERDEQEEYFSQMLMIEYSPTTQLSFEIMFEGFQDVGTGDAEFTGFRLEARWRIFEQEVPLNPTLYVEYEDLDPLTRYKMEVSGWVEPPYEEEGEEPDRERILETRLLLSQDFGRWNVAFNWINETDLQGGGTAFGYMLGVGYRFESSESFFRAVSATLELWGMLGDTHKFGLRPDLQEHYLQPTLTFHLGDLMLTLGFALGLSEDSDDLMRVMLGWSF